MPTTSIRTATARRFMDLLRLDSTLADAVITYGAPKEVGPLVVAVIIPDDGGTTVANMRSGRKARKDEFDLEVIVACHIATNDELEAAERCEQAFAAIENLLADNVTLAVNGNGLPGLIHAVQAGDSNGPSTTPGETGVLAWWNTRITCLARLD